MNFKKFDMFDNDFKLLIEAAKGSEEHLKTLGTSQKQALKRLENEDISVYHNVIFHLITHA